MSIQRIAIIFDNKARPETTGVYCRRALGKLAEVEHFLPTDLSRIPRQGFDLYLAIDDGLSYRLPSDLHPSVWWAIDTHLDFEACLSKARTFDIVFAAQRDGAENLRRHGVASASWLPLACDPEIHARHEVPREHDVCFVGNLFPGPRQELLQAIRARFPRTFIGRCYFEDMARTYSASRVVFNRSIRNDVNMRVFEALASGSLLVTNDLRDNGQEELLRNETHLVTYCCAEELLDKIDFYLKHEETRERIAAAGRTEVLLRHTYRHRMKTLLAATSQHLERNRAVASAGIATRSGALPGQAATEPSGTLPQGRDPFYFEWARPELLALVPSSARIVLDIGCGTGRLGEEIKRRQDCRVLGIERDTEAARRAQDRLDQVFVGDVETLEPGIAPHSLDAVICGDVLEHLRQPDRLLKRIHDWLQPTGLLIASIPNVRHHTVVRSLIAGNWTYEPAGLLDRDHVRFFTRREIEKLFFRAGYKITELRSKPGPGDDDSSQTPRGEVRVGRLCITGLPAEEAAEFSTYQYLVCAQPASTPDRGLTSIIIVTYNQLEYTRLCVQSIYDRTDEPFELIFIDNASTDGTPDYLGSLAGCQVVVNSENLGFPRAVNQGLRLARGRQVLLLNNDTVVTTGWLARMLDALDADDKVGLVGPCSNSVSGEQEVAAGYDDLGELDGFAWDWGKRHERVCEQTDRLVGFCLLIRGDLLRTVGELDERFGIGCFEDDDYCIRTLRAGYRAVIARDAFVHHFGGRTFIGSGVDFAALMSRNQQLLREKWREEPDGVQPVQTAAAPRLGRHLGEETAPFHLQVAPGGRGLQLVRGGIGFSLCMIVRNNARTIRAALESIRPWVDEMNVTDTGSTDDTPRIAAELGARVFHFPWCDDFSAARNESLRHARGRWIFWMDSDDTIDPECGRKLRELALGEHTEDVLGYVVSVRCPSSDPGDPYGYTRVTHVKLFRNRPDLRFEHRIHEQILPAILRADGRVEFTDLFVTHSGYDTSPEGQKHKLDRDLRLLELELREQPNHPFTLFNLGMTYADIGRHEEAADCLRRCLERSEERSSHVRKAYSLLCFCHAQMGDDAAAWDACRRGLAAFPLDAELRFRKAMLLHGRGQLEEAVRTYVDLFERPEPAHYTSVNEGVSSHLARHNLALVYLDLGDLSRAEEQFRLILRDRPLYRPGWLQLGDLLLRQGREGETLRLAEQMSSEPVLRPAVRLLRAQVALARGNREEALRGLEQAAREYPDDSDVLQALCRFLFEQVSVASAENALAQLVRCEPTDPQARHNLGTVYLQTGRPAQAVEQYRESLRLRPRSADTLIYLGLALEGLGRLGEARNAWCEALRLKPGDAAAREALQRTA
jgi:GT2 family glycosyltransferase/tetratricopeptide (TPR) repeat protein/2-polyprenyl-3-methyl-5-hydroxy-6-metoxy-1,4-benzoquinol methylase